jgi:hypothetical protein
MPSKGVRLGGARDLESANDVDFESGVSIGSVRGTGV